jgi:hypothetical protein
VPVVPKYIEDYFSTFLYSGNAGTQTVTNGIDLSTKGGMVWIKSRSGAYPHSILDTVRGFNYSGTQTKRLDPSTTDSQADAAGNATQASPLTDGFSVTTSGGGAINFYNASGQTYTSWSWAKAPKFFDVVTYTGNGAGPQVINHNLGSAPGCVIVKSTSNTSVWWVWHRGNGGSTDLTGIELNSTSASTFQNAGVASDFTATTFNAGSLINVALNLNPNVNGQTYVAYLFAHNAGGFGLTGTDNVISCGSFTSNGSGLATVNLGYEPQWVMVKGSSAVTNWQIVDNMRGFVAGAASASSKYLNANSSSAELDTPPYGLTSTGFEYNSAPSTTFIYIAIRRGPMKVPTSGTSVFSPNLSSSSGGTITTNFPVDLSLNSARASSSHYSMDRLRGASTNYYNVLVTNTTAAEDIGTGAGLGFDNNTGFVNSWSGSSYVWWNFRRAPSFFDEVCYTATISAEQTFNHNLGVNPELIFLKRRDSARNWVCWQYQGTNGLTGTGQFLNLNLTAEANASTTYNDGYVYGVSATQFAVNGFSSFNNVNSSCVAYLFATCAGVSKCTAFTGTGTLQTINCGFTSGARFVLIKRTDSTGDWYVWDSSRGLSSSTDPYLLLNSTAAEVTSTNWVDTTSTGFQVTAASGNNVNINGASYIALAIA